MSNDPTNIILDYMKSLRNSMMFGRCAGKTTRLSKLHQNRLVSELKRQNKISSLGAIAEFFTAIHESIPQLHDQGIEVENVSEEVLQVMIEIKRWITETKRPYPSLEEDPHFYLLLTENIAILQIAEREYLNICKAFFGYKQNEIKPKVRKKRFRSATEMNQHSEFEEAIEEMGILDENISLIHHRLDKLKSEELRTHSDGELTDLLKLELQLHKDLKRKKMIEDKFGDQITVLGIKNFISLHSALFPEGGIERTLRIIFYGEEILHEVIDEAITESNGGLISILGDPGWGKTIQLRQFTHGFLNDQIQEKNIHRIPIYVKAKTLSKHIRNLASSHYGFAVDLPDGGVVNHGGKTTRHVGETNQILIRSMLETESDLDEEEIRNLFGIQRSVAKNMILIVDAYDEVPSQDARFELVNFISDEIENHGWPVIMTCRNSHEEELETVFKQMNNDLNPHYKYKIHFTNEELQFVMPTKLANAWGMNGDQISHTVALEFESFKNVLTHPLFVGLFCMLKSEGAELTVLDIELNSEDRMSIHHVSFLKQVIDFGLRINIKDRKSISDEDEKVIRKAFLYIAAIHLTLGINNLDNILTIMEKLHNFSINEKHGKILAENLGVMFVNGEKEIEWTHKTLPEVALGLLLNEDRDFVDFLGDLNFGRFGKNDDLWSECLFLTIIEDDLMTIHNHVQSEKQSNQKNILEKCYELWKTNKASIIKSLRLLGFKGQIFKDVWLDRATTYGIDWRNGELTTPLPWNQDSWNFVPSKGTPFEMELRKRFGNTYFQMMLEGYPISLPIEFFGDELTTNKDGFFATLFLPNPQAGIRMLLDGFEKIEWPTFLARELDVLTWHMSPWDLTELFLKNLMLGHRFFPILEERKFCRDLKNLLQYETDYVSWELKHSELLELILICSRSNSRLDLLDTFLSCDELIPEVGDDDILDVERDKGIYSEISKHILNNVNRGDAAPGKISLSYLKQKHGLVHDKFIRVLLDVMLTDQHIPSVRWLDEEYKPGITWLDDEILNLKLKWGIPKDFKLKVTEDSSKFDKIQSIDIDKIPDTILRYIVGKIE